MAQAQRPQDHGEQPQPFCLISSAIAFGIMSKCTFTPTTLIPIDLYLSNMHIPNRLPEQPPALKGFILTIRTLLRSFFSFTLDIRQFQHHNGHNRLLEDWLSSSISYKKPVTFSISLKPTTFVTDTLCFKLTAKTRKIV
jgi:hypothetical protein